MSQDLVFKPLMHFVVVIGTMKVSNFNGPNGEKFQEVLFEANGTAFFIGQEGFFLTAAHVLDQMNAYGGEKGILISIAKRWTFFSADDFEIHPVEDIAIGKMTGGDWHSVFHLSPSSEAQACPYALWGYPERVTEELSNVVSPTRSGAPRMKPDLIINKGYIRRRLDREFPYRQYRGSQFYELSEVAGSKCSGSPVVKEDRDRLPGKFGLHVIGVYIGEETGDRSLSVGYCVRMDALLDWSPKILRRSIFSQQATYG